MRSEREMMDLIRERARVDDRVLAAYLKGSRTDPNVPKDLYRDYDVMYVVKETESFLADTGWLAPFGKVILKQEQDSPFGYGDRFGLRSGFDQLYSWLLLFEDGVRIDIGVETVAHMQAGTTRNKLFLPILDKVGCLPDLPPPSDEDYHVVPPDQEAFRGCCNEFFWSLCDVVKGLARDELPYVMDVYHSRARRMLEQMLAWYIGCVTGFSVSCGKSNRFFKRYLPEDLYARYVRACPDGEPEHIWAAVEEACSCYHDAAALVGGHLGFEYPQEEEDGFFRYLQIIKSTL